MKRLYTPEQRRMQRMCYEVASFRKENSFCFFLQFQNKTLIIQNVNFKVIHVFRVKGPKEQKN